jgi:hypothetical protein
MSMVLAESVTQLHDGKQQIYNFAKEETGQDITGQFPLGFHGVRCLQPCLSLVFLRNAHQTHDAMS